MNKTGHHQENNRKGCNQKHKKKEHAKPKSQIAKSQIARFMRGWRVGPEQQREKKEKHDNQKLMFPTERERDGHEGGC